MFTAFELNAGQMLFLPAGWFHEVRSCGRTSVPSSDCTKGGSIYDVHLALNYWFHPCDNDQFEKPYQLDFWKAIENERNERDARGSDSNNLKTSSKRSRNDAELSCL